MPQVAATTRACALAPGMQFKTFQVPQTGQPYSLPSVTADARAVASHKSTSALADFCRFRSLSSRSPWHLPARDAMRLAPT
jgi:hypothetical protein